MPHVWPRIRPLILTVRSPPMSPESVKCLKIKNTYITSPHAKAQRRKDGSAEDPFIVFLIECVGSKES